MAIQKRNISLYLGLLGLMILGGGGYFGYDQYQLLTIRQDELKVSQDQKVQKQARKTQLENTIQEYGNVKKNVADLDDILPSEKNVPELLYQLEAIAIKESGVAFKGVSINETASLDSESDTTAVASDLSELSLTVQIEGTYPSLKKYINSLEQNMRLTDITSLHFSRVPRPGEDGPEIYRLKIGMIVYYIQKK